MPLSRFDVTATTRPYLGPGEFAFPTNGVAPTRTIPHVNLDVSAAPLAIVQNTAAWTTAHVPLVVTDNAKCRAYKPDANDYWLPAYQEALRTPKKTPQELDDLSRKSQELRNEVVMIADKFVSYALVAGGEMVGMYKQRMVNSQGAADNPLYNSSAPLPEFPDFSEQGLLAIPAFVKYLDAHILHFFGGVARTVLLDHDFTTIMSDPALKKEYGISGDRWYSLGNLLKFTSQYVFSFLYKGELGLYSWMDGVAARGFTEKRRTEMREAFKDVERQLSWTKRSRAMGVILGRHLLPALAFVIKEKILNVLTPSFWTALPGRALRKTLDTTGSTLVYVSEKGALIGGGLKTISDPDIASQWASEVLSPEEAALHKATQNPTAGETWSQRCLRWMRGKMMTAKILTRGVDKRMMAYVDGKEIEPTLAQAQSKRSFGTATEKLLKFIAPTVAAGTATALAQTGLGDSGLNTLPALPLLALAHGAILYSVYYTAQGNVPKILMARGKPRKANVQQELLSGLGIYLGKGVQSLYTLWITAHDVISGFTSDVEGSSQHLLENLYNDFLQAGRNMPDPLIWATTALTVAPAIYAGYSEISYFKKALEDGRTEWNSEKSTWDNLVALKQSSTEKFSVIDRLVSHGVFGTAVVSTSLAGAWFMGDFQTQPLAWFFYILSATCTGFRSLYKHKEQIKESLQKTVAEKQIPGAIRNPARTEPDATTRQPE